jgi:cellulose biosynthesis protein BcsQ
MASPKGGSGKTVLTATFANFLHALGKKVLIIDTDASTNGLTLMYLKEVMLQSEHAIADNRTPLGTYEINDNIVAPEIVKLPNGVHLIPATYSFINTEEILLNSFTDGLKWILKWTNSDYDYIFLDAQAGSDNYAHVAMRKDVSNEVVIVSEYDPLSAAGIERLKALFREDLTYNRTWVLLNKMLPDFVQSFSDFLEVAKYLSPIPWNVEVVKAYARRKLALDLEYGNEFTLAIMQTIKVMLGDEIKKEIHEWTKSKSAIIREPIQTQYQDIKIQLDYLYKRSYKYESRQRNITFLKTMISILLLCTVTSIIVFTNTITSRTNIYIAEFAIGIALSLLIPPSFIKREHHSDRKLKSEITDLEEKLKKLDGMLHAEFDTLIKKRVGFNTKTPL